MCTGSLVLTQQTKPFGSCTGLSPLLGRALLQAVSVSKSFHPLTSQPSVFRITFNPSLVLRAPKFRIKETSYAEFYTRVMWLTSVLVTGLQVS